MRAHALVGTFVLALSALSAVPARAQTPGTTTRTIYEAQPGEVPVIVEERVVPLPRRHFLRFRAGVDATGGAMVMGPQAAFGGLRARVGLQVGDWFALYYQPTGLAGGFLQGTRPNDLVIGMVNNSFLAELTLFDWVQLGAGPSVDFVWGCANVRDSISCDEHGAYFGVDGRAAVVIGPQGPGDRTGLTLSVDVHSTWYRDWEPGVSVLGGVGFEMF